MSSSEYIEASFSSMLSAKTRAKASFEFIQENRHLLNEEEAKLFEAIEREDSRWIYPECFDWLDKKHRKYDPQYDDLRAIQKAMSLTETQIKRIEAEQAVSRLKQQEEAIQIEKQTGLPVPTEKEMEMVWRYIQTNPRMRQRLYGK